MYDGCDDYVEPEIHRQVDSNLESPSLLSGDVAPQQLYLAQVTLQIYAFCFLILLGPCLCQC